MYSISRCNLEQMGVGRRGMDTHSLKDFRCAAAVSINVRFGWFSTLHLEYVKRSES